MTNRQDARVVFLFSGQGSQYAQMGSALFEAQPVFREHMLEADAIASDLLHFSVVDALYGRSEAALDDLLFSHPAIVMLELALAKLLASEGIEPDIVCGSSLGEFAAAVVAGVWDLETAIGATIEQAKHVSSLCESGGMTAVLGGVEIYDQLDGLGASATLAGVNFSRHFTLAGSISQLEQAESQLQSRSVSFQRLPVRYGFHSSLIEPAGPSFLHYAQTLPALRAPQIPFISGLSAELIADLPQDYFWQVAREPTRVQQTVKMLEQNHPSAFVDLSPSGTLATFVKYNLPAGSQSFCVPILTPFQRNRKDIAQVISRFR